MNRIDILNAIIKKNNFTKFCEIGVQAGDCFRGVQCEYKVGVDPDTSSAATIHKTSDDFFATLEENFQIYWVDGLHEKSQVERDILNALNHLEDGGVVCCHDMLPTNFHMQEVPLTDQSEWTGNCWEAFVKLRTERDDLEMVVISTDWGCGLIWKGKQEKLVIPEGTEINYANFVANKDVWMNVRTPEWFTEVYLKG